MERERVKKGEEKEGDGWLRTCGNNGGPLENSVDSTKSNDSSGEKNSAKRV